MISEYLHLLPYTLFLSITEIAKALKMLRTFTINVCDPKHFMNET